MTSLANCCSLRGERKKPDEINDARRISLRLILRYSHNAHHDICMFQHHDLSLFSPIATVLHPSVTRVLTSYPLRILFLQHASDSLPLSDNCAILAVIYTIRRRALYCSPEPVAKPNLDRRPQNFLLFPWIPLPQAPLIRPPGCPMAFQSIMAPHLRQ